MIVKAPQFYKEFRCKAAECTDNCCIGWEIDIDPDTAELYKNTDGEFGKRLENNIDRNECTHFILTENERCPFLNSNNLCDIILNIGEDKLCEICREHPRFHSWYGSYKESGVGLCCEEAVRLLLRYGELNFYDTETNEEDDDYPFDTQLFKSAYDFREKIFDIFAFDVNIFEALKKMLALCSEYTELPDLSRILAIAEKTEPIDAGWTDVLNKIIKNRETIKSEFYRVSESDSKKYGKISAYLVYRYFLQNAVYENMISESAFFVCFFIMLLRCVDILYPNTPVDNVKLVSKQTEYSEENLEIIYEGI